MAAMRASCSSDYLRPNDLRKGDGPGFPQSSRTKAHPNTSWLVELKPSKIIESKCSVRSDRPSTLGPASFLVGKRPPVSARRSAKWPPKDSRTNRGIPKADRVPKPRQ
jgi:hypothetical protein